MTDRILELRNRGITIVTQIKDRRRERQRRSLSFACDGEELETARLSTSSLNTSTNCLWPERVQAHSSLLNPVRFESDLVEVFNNSESVPQLKQELLVFFEEHSGVPRSIVKEEVEEVEENLNLDDFFVSFSEKLEKSRLEFLEVSQRFEEILGSDAKKMEFPLHKAVTCIPEYDGAYERLQSFIDMVNLFVAPAQANANNNNNNNNNNNDNVPDNSWDMQLLAVVRTKLSGKALAKADEVMKESWAETRTALTDIFAKKLSYEEISVQISTLKQKPNESFEEYKERADKVYMAVKLLGDNIYANKELKFNFITGLKKKSVKEYASTIEAEDYETFVNKLDKQGKFMEAVNNSWELKKKLETNSEENSYASFNQSSMGNNSRNRGNRSQKYRRQNELRQDYFQNNSQMVPTPNYQNQNNSWNGSWQNNSQANYSNTQGPNQNNGGAQNVNLNNSHNNNPPWQNNRQGQNQNRRQQLNNSMDFNPQMNSTQYNAFVTENGRSRNQGAVGYNQPKN